MKCSSARRMYVPDNDQTYEPTEDRDYWLALEPCDPDTCHHPVHAFGDRADEPIRHLEQTSVIEDEGIEVPEGFLRPHPCGHFAVERGCGGCDPGAVEFVITDGVLSRLDDSRGQARDQG